MKNHPQTRRSKIEDGRSKNTMPFGGPRVVPTRSAGVWHARCGLRQSALQAFRLPVCAIFYLLSSIFCFSTPVFFPLAQMFAATNYTKPITITAQDPELTDGTNLYVGTYTIVTPTGGTNPIVQLTPNNYLLTFADAKPALRFSVPNSAVTLNVLNLITNGLASYTNWSAGLSGSGFALGSAVSGSDGEPAVWMLGIAADGTLVSNAVPVSGSSTSSNNFVGSLNVGQVYGLGSYGANVTNLVYGPIVASGNGNVTVTATTNAGTGQVTYSVASTGGISSANSNTFTGQLNAGQVYGLGNASLLSSNQLIQEAIANVAGGSATNVNFLSSPTVAWSTSGGSNVAAVVGGNLTNLNLTTFTNIAQMLAYTGTNSPVYVQSYYGGADAAGRYWGGGYFNYTPTNGFATNFGTVFGSRVPHLFLAAGGSRSQSI